jgi:hypothetical protein
MLQKLRTPVREWGKNFYKPVFAVIDDNTNQRMENRAVIKK